MHVATLLLQCDYLCFHKIRRWEMFVSFFTRTYFCNSEARASFVIEFQIFLPCLIRITIFNLSFTCPLWHLVVIRPIGPGSCDYFSMADYEGVSGWYQGTSQISLESLYDQLSHNQAGSWPYCREAGNKVYFSYSGLRSHQHKRSGWSAWMHVDITSMSPCIWQDQARFLIRGEPINALAKFTYYINTWRR
jgi:hypothetical protein